MNGPHDLGGAMNLGPVLPEPEALRFHAEWEKRALGLTLAAGALGHWNIDESRHARESLPWAIYFGATYYEIWIHALEVLLQRHALVSAAELASGETGGAAPHSRPLTPGAVGPMLARGGPADRPIEAPARFGLGQGVRARNMHPKHHTRLPRYVRGHQGVVTAVHGGFVLPDAHAHRQGEQPERLYTVRFEGSTLWGADTEPGTSVSIDAWESYLEPA